MMPKVKQEEPNTYNPLSNLISERRRRGIRAPLAGMEFWSALEAFPKPVGTSEMWRWALGEEYEVVKAAFLEECEQAAEREFVVALHEVFPTESHFKTNKEIGGNRKLQNSGLLRVNFRALASAIACALNLQPKFTDSVGIAGTYQIAELSTMPIFLTIQHSCDSYCRAVAELSIMQGGTQLKQRKPYIALTPTRQYIDARINPFLNSCQAGHFDLVSNLILLPTGNLQARDSGGKLFSKFLPEMTAPFNEAETARISALLRNLRSQPRASKAPLIDVFEAFVFGHATGRQMAKDFKCAPSLISARLRTLEKRFNVQSLANLRDLASDIKAFEASVKGDRRKTRVHGSPPGKFADEEIADDTEGETHNEEYRYEEPDNEP